jgi:tRNA-specific 2-thiouridylase
LGDREDLLTTEAVIADVRVRDWEWLQESPELQARIRYKSPAVPAHLSPIANTQSPIANCQSPIANNPTLPEGASIHFVSPVWGVTPGQSLVMYKDGLVVGGGIIQ